jgi:hypothetical protein
MRIADDAGADAAAPADADADAGEGVLRAWPCMKRTPSATTTRAARA